MRDLVLASGNKGKLAELSQMLLPLGWQVRSQGEFQLEDAEETGLSFVENAIIKARHACQHTRCPALADDSGLEVDFLQGAPGIYSARYAGIPSSDADNNAKLLSSLAGVPMAQRSARYQCVLVFMRHAEDPVPLICQGSWEGYIAEAASGDGGFGYDPLFWIPELQKTAAQLSAAQKHAMSHRGKALRLLLAALQ